MNRELSIITCPTSSSTLHPWHSWESQLGVRRVWIFEGTFGSYSVPSNIVSSDGSLLRYLLLSVSLRVHLTSHNSSCIDADSPNLLVYDFSVLFGCVYLHTPPSVADGIGFMPAMTRTASLEIFLTLIALIRSSASSTHTMGGFSSALYSESRQVQKPSSEAWYLLSCYQRIVSSRSHFPLPQVLVWEQGPSGRVEHSSAGVSVVATVPSSNKLKFSDSIFSIFRYRATVHHLGDPRINKKVNSSVIGLCWHWRPLKYDTLVSVFAY